MIDVFVKDLAGSRRGLTRRANAVQSYYRFGVSAESSYEIVLTHVHHPAMFHIPTHDKVFISDWNVDGICLYAQRRVDDFFLLASLLGLAQLRAISTCALNPEDFLHHEPVNCLFAQNVQRSDCAVKLLQPWICPGCYEFYRCLGLEPEMEVLCQILHSLADHTSAA